MIDRLTESNSELAIADKLSALFDQARL